MELLVSADGARRLAVTDLNFAGRWPDWLGFDPAAVNERRRLENERHDEQSKAKATKARPERQARQPGRSGPNIAPRAQRAASILWLLAPGGRETTES